MMTSRRPWATLEGRRKTHFKVPAPVGLPGEIRFLQSTLPALSWRLNHRHLRWWWLTGSSLPGASLTRPLTHGRSDLSYNLHPGQTSSSQDGPASSAWACVPRQCIHCPLLQSIVSLPWGKASCLCRPFAVSSPRASSRSRPGASIPRRVCCSMRALEGCHRHRHRHASLWPACVGLAWSPRRDFRGVVGGPAGWRIRVFARQGIALFYSTAHDYLSLPCLLFFSSPLVRVEDESGDVDVINLVT